MNEVKELLADLESELLEAKINVAALERCIELMQERYRQQKPIARQDQLHEGEPSEPIEHSKSGLVGVYPVGRNSKKWYASVTERGKTKRLCGTYDDPAEAAKARGDYLAKRDHEPLGSSSLAKRTFGPSNDQPV